MKTIKTEERALLGLTIFCALVVLFPEISFAGTGGEELKTLYDKTVEVAQGYGGKSIAVVSFLLGLLGAAKGNLMACGSAFGVSVVAGVGPSMVTSGISAIF
jgi:hypothetical protein